MEEDEDPEYIVAIMEQFQWTGRGITEPRMPSSLQQMFALARRMGYEMRPIARRSGTARQTPSSPGMTEQSYRAPFRQGRDYSKVKCFSCVRWDTCRPSAPNRIIHFPSGRMGGTHNPMVHDNTLMDHNRETAYRPGTHPHRSARDSFGPMHRSHQQILRDSFTHLPVVTMPPEIMSSLWIKM